ncbi:hypothetical protein [uncultured Methylobacterium sp.]|uniref:hypothetical protein n=1 Tax=uncultured Methylobacterium sp. TaxID=157278 RepID=UPI0035CC1F00
MATCNRCAKRRGLPKRALRDLLKAEMKRSRPRVRLRIVATGCLGPCPRRLIAVATGASLAGGRVLLIDPAAPPAETLAALLIDHVAPGRVPKEYVEKESLPPKPGIGDGRNASA